MSDDKTPDDHGSTTQIHGPIGDPDTTPPLPERLGRYVIRSRLGTGGFAEVYLAHDEELDRDVALKVPRPDKFTDDEALRQAAEEARMAAGLQHPGIVPVYDVGTHEGIPYIVLQYIRGRSLDHLLQHDPPSHAGAARLTAEVALALGHAHDRGFVHRDIKPRNILLDMDDSPHVADFGLAVRHREISGSPDDVAGTTRYMSPEQVRGENHRIDGRTDIWGLGVLFYQMLTGRLPFNGSSSAEVYQRIVYDAPVPPRQINPQIPEELERICLRCLCRQMSERYRKATDLAEDLFEWLQFVTGDSGGSGISGGSSFRRRLPRIEAPDAPLIPRGLRSFGREDVDFFLRLVPGPRDRDGLPVSLRFWKHRIEEREADETFRVGLLYGPSGCGKSSLVKAGLLPRLSPDVACVYVETSSQDMESKLLRLLRRRFRRLPDDVALPEALRQLREESQLRDRKKLVIVLDQFEQCLHANTTGPSGELLRGLLQCDGGNVQCLLMVRDDFWLPVSRFMSQLEIGIVDGENAMLVDSFDPAHARSVLREFGVAYSRLPEKAADQTEQQTEFLEQAMLELAEEGRLYPVRLAVFVEMVRDREWVPATLSEMGGVEGVGVAFLENSVGALASPARRVHEQAARNVLSLLLPPAGQIKGPVRTCSEVLEASGYARQPRAFEELMHLLDVELRLLTPAGGSAEDSSRRDDAGDSETSWSRQEMTYQLTHDFLVPSIREWLERQMRSARGGRLRLLLQEQADLWNGRPSPRYLPSLVEWAGIRLFTNRREWTEPQRRMMRAVARRLARQACLVAAGLLLGVLIGWRVYQETVRPARADLLCSKLQDVDMTDVPEVVADMADYREWTDPLLQDVVSDTSQPERDRIRAAIALLPSDDRHIEWLTDRLVSEQAPPDDFLVLRGVLQPYGERVAGQLRARLEDELEPQRRRFRAACALVAFDRSAERWQELGGEVVTSLLREPGADSRVWTEALRPLGARLTEPLMAELAQTNSLEFARIGAAALSEFNQGRLDQIVELLASANGDSYRAYVEVLRRDPEQALRLLRKELGTSDGNANGGGRAESTANAVDVSDRRRANLAQAAFELGDPSCLADESKPKPDPDVRTLLVHGMNPQRMDVNQLFPLIFEVETDQSVRNVALLAIWRHLDEPMTENLRERLVQRLLEVYSTSQDAEGHSAAALLLRKLGRDLAEPNLELMAEGPVASRDWFINDAGQTMVIVDPAKMPETANGVDYMFAISSTEVTYDQFREFFSGHSREPAVQVDFNDVAATEITPVHIAAYCNRLSNFDGIDPEEWCYPPESELTTEHCFLRDDFLQRAGYRLPRNTEWELACRAGTTTNWSFGDDGTFLEFYGWTRKNSQRVVQRVGQLLPNPWGLFDCYGNVYEVTIAHEDSTRFYHCGASCRESAAEMNSSTQTAYDHRVLRSFQGFRVVRTLELPDRRDAEQR